jgi:hypothetical protein
MCGARSANPHADRGTRKHQHNSAEGLSEALLAMMNARMVCYEEHVADALAIYDSVARSLIPGMNRNMLPNLATNTP